jgi:hypothetical protein
MQHWQPSLFQGCRPVGKPNGLAERSRTVAHISLAKDKLSLSFARLICKRESARRKHCQRRKTLPNPLKASLTDCKPSDTLRPEA